MSLTLVVMGMAGRNPFAGVAWQFLHYLEGLRRLGHDVFYVEDTGAWPFDPDRNTKTADPGYAVSYLGKVMAAFGMEGRWAYRHVGNDDAVFGFKQPSLHELFRKADGLINVTGSTVLTDEHLQVPVRVYVETDPVIREIEVAQGNQHSIELLDAHTHHFTFAQNLGAPDCGVPVSRYRYITTRQPVVVDWWDHGAQEPASLGDSFTTVANWRQAKDIAWSGETYSWSKHLEFLKFIDLPTASGLSFELALGLAEPADVQMLQGRGWRVIDAAKLSREPRPYWGYIVGSRGEFTVAKDQNVRLRSGWFSDRSACYLAAGRPVVTQDTGFGAHLPLGEGLFAFRTMEDVLTAMECIQQDYDRHRRAARAIAEEFFRAEVVLDDILVKSGLT
jgi:hypothetical protein